MTWLQWDQIAQVIGLDEKQVAENPEHENTEPEVELEENPEPVGEEVELPANPTAEKDTLEDPVEEPITDDPVVEEPVEPAVTPTPSGKLYHIIGGAFSSLSNAETLVDQLKSKGYGKAKVLGKRNGLHTVSLEGYSDKDEAKKQLKSIENSGDSDGAWILYY